MKKTEILYISAAVLAVISLSLILIFSDGAGINGANIRFLRDFGIEVQKKPVETADIRIPDPFDLVYENYNELQLDAGLDLRPYAGMRGKRYTYIVTNYPYDIDDEVRANIICVNKKQVGGDVMTVSLTGFMVPLNFMLTR